MRKKNYIALAIGLGLAVLTAIPFKWQLDFVLSSAAAQGRVVGPPHGGHHPEITFTTQTGERVSFSRGSFSALDIDDDVTVLYDPANPRTTAQIDTFMDLWEGPLISGICALLFLWGGWTGQEFKRGRY